MKHYIIDEYLLQGLLDLAESIANRSDLFKESAPGCLAMVAQIKQLEQVGIPGESE